MLPRHDSFEHDTTHTSTQHDPHGTTTPTRIATTRRRFVGYVVGGATLVAAADMSLASPATAAPSVPQIPEAYDLNDFLTDAARPTANLITVEIRSNGTAHFSLPRAEVGQGVTTSTAMIIAEELDIPVRKVKITLSDARPELVWNQLTGASNTTISTYTPIRVAAAIARGALLEAAAIQLGAEVAKLEAKGGIITAPDGSSISYGELAEAAASAETREVEVALKEEGEFEVIGKPYDRIDARQAVTGRKNFVTDLQVKDAWPTMICRAPTLNGTPRRIRNKPRVLRMDGVTDVEMVEFGVAVRARTFGQCIDAVRELDVVWADGPVAGQSDGDIVRELKGAEVALPAVPDNPLLKTIERDYTFYFRSNSAMDTNSAIADVRSDSAEIWTATKSPIIAQQTIAEMLGLPQDAVTLHVEQAGGSFGRRLFYDGAIEAAQASKAFGKPVKLMWHRADDARAGRAHPMAVHKVRAAYVGEDVLAFQQTHTSVETDYRHGLGELITAKASDLPAGLGNQGFAQTIFALTQEVPYNVGAIAQTLLEVDERFNTASMRNIYSPDVRTAGELMIDELADTFDKDPYEYRLEISRNERLTAVLKAVAAKGEWGRRMPAGTAQGIAVHKEYKGVSACLVEIDTRPRTVNRDIPNAVTGPRVTKVTFAIDVGRPINPRGLEAQMQGGINDGIALALTSSLHLRDGHFLEGSWDNYFYTRQWNTPPDVRVIVMPAVNDEPGGAGEAGVAATFAAVACAWRRATGKHPRYFPLNHQELSFKPKPFVPPVPQSPTNGLKLTY